MGRSRIRGAGAAIVVVAMVQAVGLAPVAAAPPPVVLAPAVNSPTGSPFGPGPGAQTTATADLDGDGLPDVVVTDFATTNPRWLRNEGGGIFGPAVPLPAASGVLSIVAADIDGDGAVDIVGRSTWAVVLWRGNGDGTFAAPQDHYLAGNAQPAIAVADINGDGVPDVVTTTLSGFQVLWGGTAGLTTGPRTLAGGVLSDLAIANLDGDAHPDVVVVDASPFVQRVRTYLGTGTGAFSAAGTGPTGFGPEAANIGDLDGDGIDDVVTSDSFSIFSLPPRFSITVLISDGSGGFSRSTRLPTAAGPVSGAVGDLNGDGAPDVVVAGVLSTGLAVYVNDGAGNLAAAPSVTVVAAPQTPVIEDLDGDGKPDVAVPGISQLSFLRNAG